MLRPKLVGSLFVIGVMAVALAGCSRGFPHGGGGGHDSAITIVAPGDHSQVNVSGNVDVLIRVDRHLAASTLRLQLVTGGRRAVDLTSRLHATAHGFATTLTAADLAPGLSRIVATARGSWRHAEPQLAIATVSWEPAVDATLASRCDFLGQSRCALPFPNDWLTTRDPSTDTGRRVNLNAASLTANVAGVHIDPTD
jgi:hypothetical protein